MVLVPTRARESAPQEHIVNAEPVLSLAAVAAFTQEDTVPEVGVRGDRFMPSGTGFLRENVTRPHAAGPAAPKRFSEITSRLRLQPVPPSR